MLHAKALDLSLLQLELSPLGTVGHENEALIHPNSRYIPTTIYLQMVYRHDHPNPPAQPIEPAFNLAFTYPSFLLYSSVMKFVTLSSSPTPGTGGYFIQFSFGVQYCEIHHSDGSVGGRSSCSNSSSSGFVAIYSSIV
jgi:hypothetical protein